MIQLVIFDLDGVLAPHGKPIDEETSIILRTLSKYARIAFASGKPAPYLEGISRGLGLEDSVIIGENGGVIFIPREKKEIFFQEISMSSQNNLAILKYDLNSKLKELCSKRMKKNDDKLNESHLNFRFQQNIINVTIFPFDQLTVKDVEKECTKIINQYGINDLKLYIHEDSVDVVPQKLNKGWAIDRVSKELGINLKNMAAVGDDTNDIEMLATVGTPFAVGDKLKDYWQGEVLDNRKKAHEVRFLNTGKEALLEILKSFLD